MSTDPPDIIDTYQQAHDRRDTDAALAVFTADATVVDEGHTYTGIERIRWWLDNAASQYTYTRALTSIDDHGNGTYTVHNHLSGDFPAATPTSATGSRFTGASSDVWRSRLDPLEGVRFAASGPQCAGLAT